MPVFVDTDASCFLDDEYEIGVLFKGARLLERCTCAFFVAGPGDLRDENEVCRGSPNGVAEKGTAFGDVFPSGEGSAGSVSSLRDFLDEVHDDQGGSVRDGGAYFAVKSVKGVRPIIDEKVRSDGFGVGSELIDALADHVGRHLKGEYDDLFAECGVVERLGQSEGRLAITWAPAKHDVGADRDRAGGGGKDGPPPCEGLGCVVGSRNLADRHERR
jgi:hypothetical protein